MELKAFDKNDWMAFAGCEKGPDGEEPMIGEIANFIVVADNNGVAVYEYLGGTENPHGQCEYFMFDENEYESNIALASYLTEEHLCDPGILAKLGFFLGQVDTWGDQDHD